ncbi:MAG: Spy/CpxP family protein refolding chaperone [Candidatus Solibacter usitatus]|nr:Spy/CpxP family protein refolding chaperone [Candidatus Solibacter usitatus]
MKKRILYTIIVASVALAALPAQEHTPPTAAQRVADRVARLTTLLTLNAAQQAEATTIFTAEQNALAGVMTSMRTARTALKAAVQKNDQAAIATQAAQIGSLVTQEVQAQATAEAAFYAILDTTQQAKFNELHAPGFGGGPGGFGGRGRGPGGPGPH